MSAEVPNLQPLVLRKGDVQGRGFLPSILPPPFIYVTLPGLPIKVEEFEIPPVLQWASPISGLEDC